MPILKTDSGYMTILNGSEVKKVRTRKEIKEEETILAHLVESIGTSKAEQSLIKEFNYPEAIILYGSHVRGESIEGSDIDLFIIGKYKDINLELYEDKLGKRIHLMYDQNAEKIPSELKNNLINGIILKGYLKVFK